jgi:hypothetical protein
MALLKRIGAAALLLLGFGEIPAPAQEAQVGKIADRKIMVKGRRGDSPQAELKKGDAVFVGMEVQTFAGAGARIAINRDLRQQRGAVVLGPKTIVKFTGRLVNEALGLAKMSWFARLGQFRLAILPPPPGSGLEEGEYLIETPGGAKIRLQGTDVAVQVDRNGTVTVWVIEGEAEVTTAAGGRVQVPAGYRTRVRPGHAPEPPVRFGPADGPGPGVFPNPAETIFPDPPRLDLRSIRLDLPG